MRIRMVQRAVSKDNKNITTFVQFHGRSGTMHKERHCGRDVHRLPAEIEAYMTNADDVSVSEHETETWTTYGIGSQEDE